MATGNFRFTLSRLFRRFASSSSSFGDLNDLTVLRRHAVRALCGALLDRHTACKSPHPFCGSAHHRRNGDTPRELIAEAIPQGTDPTGDANLIGIYLCPASAVMNDEGEHDVMEYISRMAPTQPAPTFKLVVNPPEDGRYLAHYGPILNPVPGDFSTGRLDYDNSRPINCNPEPRHCRWRYWESNLAYGELPVPRYHCLQVFGQWWVVEVDRSRKGLVQAQQVAGLDFADNPEHNLAADNYVQD